VVRAHPDRLELVGIAARANHRRLAEIARHLGVRHVGIFDSGALAEARADLAAFPAGTRLYGGLSGLMDLAQLPEADLVLVAVVGTTGLRPALAALAAGKHLALASKEILVLAGKFVMAAAHASGVRLLPVDSEHNAVFQCLEGHLRSAVRRIVLTASGGALRDLPVAALAAVTPAEALKHPNWAMGPKITVDSATLANKGLELMEAQWLFGLRPDQCDAVLHPQSIVHCLVEFIDGSMLAQLAPPSMTFPLQHALLYPERAPGTDAPLDLCQPLALDFRPVDDARYPCLRLARAAMTAGGVAPAVFNAANEIAVAAFLAGRAPFLAIPEVIDQTLQSSANFEPADLEAVLTADAAARRLAQSALSSLSTRS
jgi:1-deoxy-D-xylulose-5-phosphate reductoisomerase